MYRLTASALPARNVIVVRWSEIHNIWCPSFRIPTSFLVIRIVVTSKSTAWLNFYGGYLLVPFYSISAWCIFSNFNFPRRSPVAVFIIYSCTFTWTKISWELFQLQFLEMVASRVLYNGIIIMMINLKQPNKCHCSHEWQYNQFTITK